MGGPLTFDAPRKTVARLQDALGAIWMRTHIENDLNASAAVRITKRWPLSIEAERLVRARAQGGDADAFLELVARDPRYLFTDAGRAWVYLWHVQHRLHAEQIRRGDEGASVALTRLGKALARATRSEHRDAAAFARDLANATADVRRAARVYTKNKNNRPSASKLARECQINLETATTIAVSKRIGRTRRGSAWLQTAIDVEMGARLGVSRERVAQLRRSYAEHEREGYV